MAKNRKPRAAQAPKDETPSERFSRLASKRVTKAVKAIRNIGTLSGRSYQRTDEQVQAVLAYLKDAVKYVEGCFAAPDKAAASEDIKI